MSEEEKALLERNAHISSDEILRDIADTEREIATMQQELEGLRLMGDRWSDMRADARKRGIRDRQIFIEKLQNLLRLRTEAEPVEAL